MRRLILRSQQSPGDVLMLTAAVRDLHAAHPRQFQTDVRTSAPDLWLHNPYLTPLSETDPTVETLDMHYPLVHQSNQRPYHFLHGYVQYLEDRLKLKIPLTAFQGDLYLSDEERASPPPGVSPLPERFWLVLAGGKYDFTAKWWNPASYQQVVDHFRGTIDFLQCGEAGHWHPPLTGVTNLIGKTSLRDFVRLMHFAEGVVCPVTLAMHLAAAVPRRPGSPPNRACIVLAGGREPPHWEAYPSHQFLHTIGQLDCCATGGCWKSRCQPVGDGDAKDRRERCERPVAVRDDLLIPQCLELIRPAEVIAAIERTRAGWSLRNGSPAPRPAPVVVARPVAPSKSARPRRVLVKFRHGLGDAVQFTAVLRHLRHYHPDWEIDIAALRGKHSAFRGLCRQPLILDGDPLVATQYDEVHSLEWEESRVADGRWPNTKVTRCLQDVFRLSPIADLCRYEIPISAEARQSAAEYLESLCGPPSPAGRYRAVLIHYEGNTSGTRKNLSTELIRQVCEDLLALDHVPVILDWDRRSPLPDDARIFCPGADHPLWRGSGTGDAEQLAALIDAARLMIGIDSGPLHVAGATGTPTIGVWTQHHPLQFFDLAPHVTHLVPGDHAQRLGDARAAEYFRRAYQHRVYRQLDVELPALVESLLTGINVEEASNKRFLKRLNATSYGETYYEEHRQAGLDYLGFGDWQQRYGRWLRDVFGWQGRKVLDVGCACGSILRGLGEAGIIVQGVDVNEYMIQRGRLHWPDMAPLLRVCDAVNLHLYADGDWHGIHTAQVAEHWKPVLVPHILQELHRVVTPGGLIFCALDTVELFARQGRRIEDEDPTHICIEPLEWWHAQFHAAGWDVCSQEFRPALAAHPESFLKEYDWDWVVARRRA